MIKRSLTHTDHDRGKSVNNRSIALKLFARSESLRFTSTGRLSAWIFFIFPRVNVGAQAVRLLNRSANEQIFYRLDLVRGSGLNP